MQIHLKSEQLPSQKLEATTPTQPNISYSQQAKKAKDLAILSANVPTGAAENPMDLLYKTAIEEINKQLEPVFGNNAAQSAYDSGLDVSPEATAQRIVQGVTGFYQAFKEENSELTNEQSLDKFVSIINSGLEQGFAEAKEILDSLSVLEGEIESNINSTYNLVQQGLSQFKEQLLVSLNPQEGNINSVENKATRI